MMEDMKRLLKQIPKKALPALLLTLAVCALIFTAVLSYRAEEMGSRLGVESGSLAGKFQGSFQGLTNGRAEGSKAGKHAGLSAADTEAKIADELKLMERLEVLAASVKLHDFHVINNPVPLLGFQSENNQLAYAALYLVNGNIVFTVDMSKAEVFTEENALRIMLPEPEGTLYLDTDTIEKAAEYQRKYFNGSAEDGFDAYLNTMIRIQTASEKSLNNYEILLQSAKRAAERQITLLAQAVSVQPRQVIIEFKS